MKIYTRCVYAWQPDGAIVLEDSDSFDYEGPIAICKDSPSMPPAPDYTGAAKAQGAANKETAVEQGFISNPNITSPYGSQNVTWDVNQDAFKRAQSDFANTGSWYLGGTGYATAPQQSQFMNSSQPTVTQTLNPQSQQIFDAQQQARLGLSNLAQQGIGTAQNTLCKPFQFQGPDVQASVGNPSVQGAPNLSSFGSAGANVQAGQGTAGTPNLGSYGQAGANLGAGQGIYGAPNLQTQVGAGQIQGGPSAGQYGYAQGGQGFQQAQGIGSGQQAQGMGDNFATAQGVPNMFGQLQGISGGQYGQAQGVGAGQQAGGINPNAYGQAGANVQYGQLMNAPNAGSF